MTKKAIRDKERELDMLLRERRITQDEYNARIKALYAEAFGARDDDRWKPRG